MTRRLVPSLLTLISTIATVCLSGCGHRTPSYTPTVGSNTYDMTRPSRLPLTPPDPQASVDYVKSLTPNPSGPGVLIGEPITTNADAATGDFGACCSNWLEIVVGGQGACGRTPMFSEINNARSVLHKPNARVLPSETKAFAQLLGVTAVATSTISGGPGQCTITYRLRTADDAVLGAPITVSGSFEQVLAALPGVAKTMDARLSINDFSGIPPQVAATPADMTALGFTFRDYDSPTLDSQVQQWRASSARSPIAGIFLVSNNLSDPSVVSQLVEQAHGNAYILGSVRYMTYLGRESVDQEIETALAAHPRNYALLRGRMTAHIYNKDLDGARKVAEAAVMASPRNPWAWLALSFMIRDQAGDPDCAPPDRRGPDRPAEFLAARRDTRSKSRSASHPSPRWARR